MDIKELGTLFLVGFHGTVFTREIRTLMEELNPCGVILFARNIEDPVQVATLNRDVQENALARTGTGLFIGVDQEGGRVRRLKEPFTEFPPALECACSSDPESEVRRFARVTAEELLLAGFNLDFIPVLDVLSHSENLESSVIGDRSYGGKPAEVARLGHIIWETMARRGVIPCAKHFPGHGGTIIDSHFDLPVDNRSAEWMEGFDLIPFKEAVESSIDMLMTAHVLYPDLDPSLPATLSSRIIQRLLRDNMGYEGVVITDDLDMGAVAKRHSPEECALKAFSAGADILLFCNDPQKAFSAREAVFAAIRSGDISEERVSQSFGRIEDLKTRYAGSLRPCDPKKARDRFEFRV